MDDEPMEEDRRLPGRRRERSNDRSPPDSTRRRPLRSASPRTRQSRLLRATLDDTEWVLNPLNSCITHRNYCDICRTYLVHFNDAAMDMERSMLNAVDHRQEMITDHYLSQVRDAQSKTDRYRTCAFRNQQKLDEADDIITAVCGTKGADLIFAFFGHKILEHS